MKYIVTTNLRKRHAHVFRSRIFDTNLLMLLITISSACSNERYLITNDSTNINNHSQRKIEQKTRQKEHFDSTTISVNITSKNCTTIIEKDKVRYLKQVIHDTITNTVKDTVYIQKQNSTTLKQVEVRKKSHHTDIILLLTLLIFILWKVWRLNRH